MGSRPRYGNIGGYDVLITTSKGSKGIGTFGVIIPTGYAHANEDIRDFVNSFPHYVAKHCNDIDEITHITERGSVNRYGYLFTKKKLNLAKEIDVDKGWFSRKNFSTKKEMLDYVKNSTEREDEL